MKILVTGGGGFLGSHIVEALLGRGDSVRMLQRSPADALAERGVEVIRGDIGDAAVVMDACRGCEAVIHTAAMAGVWGAAETFTHVNVTGTENVVAACKTLGVRLLVHTSTPSVVYSGEAFEGADESLPLGTDFPAHYPSTKAIAERVALSAHNEDGLRVCALRPHLIWGVGDPHLVPRVIAKAQTGRLRIVGDGTNRVDLTHVKNAAHAHLLALDALAAGSAGGKAYFISDGAPVALWDWINSLLEHMGEKPVTKKIPLTTARKAGAVCEWLWRTLKLKGEPPMTRFVATELAKSHWFDISAARRDLGYEPVIDNTTGLDELVANLISE